MEVGVIIKIKLDVLKFRNRLIYEISKLGISVSKTKTLERHLKAEFRNRRDLRLLSFICEYGVPAGIDLGPLMDEAKGQLDQDIWVCLATQFKENGSFIEVGGADGVTFSNTWLLEKRFNWTGVIVEPGHIWHEQLRKNRSCKLDSRCCAFESGATIEFLQTPLAMLSTIAKYKDGDLHAHERGNGVSYGVETVSLNEIFESYFPDGEIDYLSIDTEGSEEEILKGFDFNRFSFNFASIEINSDHEKGIRINEIMNNNGYRRVLKNVSEFDDYYVKCI